MTLREGKWRQPTDYLLHRSGGGIGNGCCQVGQQQQRGSGNNSEKKIGRKIYNQPGVFCAAEAATGSNHRQKRQQLTGCLLRHTGGFGNTCHCAAKQRQQQNFTE